MRDRLGDIGGRTNPFGQEVDDTSNPFGNTTTRPDEPRNINPFESSRSNNVNRNDALPPLSQRPKVMDQFFQEVEAIQSAIADINASSQSISELNDQVALTTGSDAEEDMSLTLDRIMRETNHKTQTVKAGLEQFKEELTALRKSKSTSSNLADEIRTRENMSTTLTRTFMKAMRAYQLAQQSYQASIKTKIRRQIQIVKPDASTEDVEVMLQQQQQGKGGGQNIYKSAILEGSIDGAIQNAYDQCQDRYLDVLKLESSVAEVHQMFQDLAVVVEQQGGMLDQIETSVQSASNYVEKGNEQLSKAIQHQSCARKKQCCLVFFGLVILFVITMGLSM